MTETLNPTIDFIAGTVAGMTSLAVGFPFDTVKVRFQSPEIANRYSSTFGALVSILREERLVGLYRGISSPLATVALMNGLVFASYRFFMRIQLIRPEDVPTLTQVGLAGIGSGIISSIITTPTELIKIRQQTMQANSTARSVAWNILQESGIRGLYRGITATALRDCGYGAYFVAYEATCRYFTPTVEANPDHLSLLMAEVEKGGKQISWPALFIAGALAGIAGWVITFPFDVVKTRIQAASISDSPLPLLVETPGTGMTQAHRRTYTAIDPSHQSISSLGGSSHKATPFQTDLIYATQSRHNTHASTTTSHEPNLGQSEALLRRFSQTDTTAAIRANPYATTLSTIIHSYRTEGILVFFHGLTPTLIR